MSTTLSEEAVRHVDVAARFVDLALSHDRWLQLSGLPPDDVKILSATVTAAGFKPAELVMGKVFYEQELEGRAGDDEPPVNVACPYKVAIGGKDDVMATGWLDCAVRRVAYGSDERREDRDELIEAIAIEIARSVPLKPIQITDNGQLLLEPQALPRASESGFRFFINHRRDESALNSTAGVHRPCGSEIFRYRASAARDALICRSCNLRVLFPREVKTYGDLRQAMMDRFAVTA